MLLRRSLSLQTAVFACATAIAASQASDAAEYHVAVTGCDANEGAAEQPWLTIQRAAEKIMPGDTCIIHEGTYRETVRPTNSGTADRRIRFTAATGEKVQITGTDLVHGWLPHEGRIWKLPVEWPVEQLFCNGKLMVPAQFPNAGDDPYRPNLADVMAGPGKCTAEALVRPKDYWKGTAVWILRKNAWVAVTATVAESDADTLKLEGKGPFRNETTAQIRLTGLLSLLDAPREWHQEGKTLYFRPPTDESPNRLEVEATRRRFAFDLAGRSHIEIDGLELFAASVNFDNAECCTLDNCRVRYASFERNMKCNFNRDRGANSTSEGLGIVLGGRGNAVRNTVVAYCIGDGISVFGEDNTVENCVIHDCNISASDCAPITATGKGHVFLHNTLYKAGRSLLVHRHLKRGRIEHNHLYDAGLLVGDLGGTYCFQTDGEGTVIAYNRIHDVHCHTGVAIYIDNDSANHVIHHNLCYRAEDCGLRLNTPAKNIRIYNNTFSQNGKGLASWGRSGATRSEIAAVNNIVTESAALKDIDAHHNFLDKEPGFVDAAKGRFELKPDSPCISAGAAVEGVAAGHTGKVPDLGCFEHGKPAWTAGSNLPQERWDFAEKW